MPPEAVAYRGLTETLRGDLQGFEPGRIYLTDTPNAAKSRYETKEQSS
jgi:hypothetical protein